MSPPSSIIYLADPIDVTVVGQDFHVGGNYKSRQAFHDGIYTPVAAALKVETIRAELVRGGWRQGERLSGGEELRVRLRANMVS